SAGWGAAIAVDTGGAVSVQECVFTRNQTTSGGPGIFVGTAANASLTNCLFYNNASQFEGGAIAHYGNHLDLVQCTIADNDALYTAGGAYLFGQSSAIENSVFWNNTVSYTGASSQIIAPEQTQLDGAPSALAPGALTLSFCDIQSLQTNGPGPLLYQGAGCISFDPLFADPATGNYQLTAASPAIGAANAAFNSGPTDLAGNSRVMTGRLDQGAFEFQGSPQATLSLLAQPASQTDCSGTTTSFIIAGATNANYDYQWEYNNGLGFIPASEGGFAITTVSNTSVLTINSPTSAMNGWLFEVSIGGYTSPPATLTVIEPSVLFVQPGGQGNGLSWGTAFGNIADAVAAAGSCTEVWVSAGTYVMTNDAGQPQPLALKSGVRILGGFSGTETSDTQRNWTANPTVLQMAPGAPGPLPSIVENNGASVVDRSAVLDGFILANGDYGIVNSSADPTIRHCVFSNFLSYAIYNVYRGSPLLQDCVFQNNRSTAVESVSAAVVASNCLFQANAATKNGAAFDNQGGSLTVADSQFTGNATTQSGGAISGLYCHISLSRSFFAGNSAEFGGAVSAQNGTMA